MTKRILGTIILFGLLSFTNCSNKNEENDDSIKEEIYFGYPFDSAEVDTVALMSDEFELIHDNKFPVSIINPGEKIKLVGELGLTLGETATVCGIITEMSNKGYGDGPNLIVQKINGVPFQRIIQIPVSPFALMEFGKYPLPRLENDATYRFRVYETGEFVGIPGKAYDESAIDILIQTTGFYFQNRLIIISGRKINKLEWAPADFVGQKALLQGTAKNEKGIPTITGSKWKLKLINTSPFTKSEIGKLVETYGKIQRIEGHYSCYVEDDRTRLVKLEDQIGKNVKLRGIACNINEYWWLNYRGTDLYVENMDKLPNWTGRNFGNPIEITGTLEQAKLPRIDQIGLKEDRDKKMYYIVRNATWKSIDELLSPEINYQE